MTLLILDGTHNAAASLKQRPAQRVLASPALITTATLRSSRLIVTSAWSVLIVTAPQQNLSIALFTCKTLKIVYLCTVKVCICFFMNFWLISWIPYVTFTEGVPVFKGCYGDIPDTTRAVCDDENYLDCKKCSGGDCNVHTQREGNKCHQCTGVDCLVVSGVSNLVDCRSSCFIGMNCKRFHR